MNWLFIIIIAYLLNAVAVAIDKFLLTAKIPNPAIYAFFISALSLLAVVLAPFGFRWYSAGQIVVALSGGVIFTFALLYMFKALGRGEASRITPFIGGLQPILIFVLAWFFLGETLSLSQIAGFAVIIAGTVAISWQSGSADRKSYLFAIVATALFAVSYTINKYVFIEQDFISGFVWTRVGAFIGAMILLLSSATRRDLKIQIKTPAKKSGGLFVIGQIAGASSFILVNYAIAISTSVAMVNALQGLQYVFLLIIVIVLGRRFPRLLGEKLTLKILIQKITATILIIAGLFILFI